MPVTYASYLKVDELLSLQAPLSEGPEHDEMLFIIIHQVYELWFKQVLHECGLLGRSLEAKDVPASLRTFKRVLTIMKTMVAQIDVIETMTPLSFNSFRARLESASGFQSAQFRVLEFTLGHRGKGRLAQQPTELKPRLEAVMQKPSLWDSFVRYLSRAGHPVPASALERDITEPTVASPELQAVLVEVYRRDPVSAQLAELMVDLDEGIQEWRYRHVKMVERTIGTKSGTGGSSGAEYLKATLFKPLFPDLWAIRAAL
ncbi:MAG: tryptophan 2,3-dioxygenase [Deltaproteobacteria bacterium]|nr:tryptophan 2,3-dioxygenase [Deltaproteobacteria bacterium]